jgi:hypothetical protein
MALAGSNTNIELITKYSTDGFDEQYVMEACSSILRPDKDGFKFLDAKTVKIAKMAFGGLGFYHSNNAGDPRSDFGGNGNTTDPYDSANPDAPYYGNGYAEQRSDLDWETFTIELDRSAKYVIEKFSNEESAGLMVGKGMAWVNRHVIIPEVDAVCFAKLYQYAGHKVDDRLKIVNPNGVSVDAPLAALSAGFTVLGKDEVDDTNQVIFASFDFVDAMRNSAEIFKTLKQEDYSKDVKFRITTYEGRPMVVVPPKRFQTSIALLNKGYRASTAADIAAAKAGNKNLKIVGDQDNPGQDIDFIIMDKSAAVHITKFEQTKILTGEFALAATNMDAYVMYARIYHDVFVPENKRPGIYVHTGWFSARNSGGTVTTPAQSFPKMAVNVTLKAKGTGKAEITDILAVPYDQPFSLLKHNGTGTVTVGTTVVGPTTNASANEVALGEFTRLRVGDVIDTTKAAADTVFVIDGKGNVIAGNGNGLTLAGVTFTGD